MTITTPHPRDRLLGDEYLETISDAIKRAPRSLQTMIGPSELGHPCSRRIGYKLLGQPERDQTANWKATVGTACHSWLEDVFGSWNHTHDRFLPGRERFLTETKVSVGEVNGVEVWGSCDLYDRDSQTVTDWKTVGPTQLRKYRSQGPGPQYRAQAHLYGRGWLRGGLPVSAVQIVFLPRNGELWDTFVWTERFQEEIATTALQRVSGIAMATKALGPLALEHLLTADAFCHLCPYFLHGSDDLGQGCPGDPGAKASQKPEADPFPFGRV